MSNKDSWSDQQLIKWFLAKREKNKQSPLTGAEISEALNRPGIYRRLSEMKRMGLAKKVGRRTCTITGKTADTWADDDSPPTPAQIKKPLVHENRVLKDRIKFLEEKVIFLEQRIASELAMKMAEVHYHKRPV